MIPHSTQQAGARRPCARARPGPRRRARPCGASARSPRSSPAPTASTRAGRSSRSGSGSGGGGRRSRSSRRCRAACRPPTAARAPRPPSACSPASASASNICSDRRATCSTCASLVRKRWARLVTDSRRTSSSRGGSRSESSCSKKTPSRSPASVTSISSKPPCSIAAATTSAPPRITSPRSGLMPRTDAALRRGLAGELLDQLLQRVAGEHEALHVEVGQVHPLLHRGGEVADRAAEPGQAPAALAPPLELLERARHVLAQRLHLLGASPPRPGRKASLTRTAPRRTDSASRRRRSSMRMSCTLPPPTSMPKPSSSVVELAIAR